MSKTEDKPVGGRPPHIVVVDEAEEPRVRTVAALERRYGADYRIVAHSSPRAALEELTRLREAGAEVAVVLADQWMPEMAGTDLLGRVNALFPLARRGLLIE